MADGQGRSVPEKVPEQTPDFARLLEQYGGPIRFKGKGDGLYERHLVFDNVADPSEPGRRQQYEALARAMRDILAQRWRRTDATYDRENPKRVYYLSLEFLIGRSLANNVLNLRLDPVVRSIVEEARLDWPAVLEEEPDAGLGNGGLGRLAACFLDSMATLQLPAMGYGLRYEYGIFRQTIDGGWQHEQPDTWLRDPDPWEVARPREAVEIKLGSSFVVHEGTLRAVLGRPSHVLGIPYDRPIVGYGGKTINTLRLWACATPDVFDLQAFSAGAFVNALAQRLAADSVTRVLYPDDSTIMGRGLRFVQEYFLVACSLADLVRRFRRHNADWSTLPDKAAIQLNDTHPSLAVPELMRILLDDAGLGWDQAWDITRRTLAYTNHTLLPEALEKWPLRWFELMLPRHLEIILDINQRLLDEVRTRFPNEGERARQVSLVEEGGDRNIRMANLAIVGSHSTNGVAAIHSRLLRTVTVKDLADLFPERFNNKTNGVTPRRWLLLANPALAGCITEAIGDGWITDLAHLARLKPLADDAGFRDAVRQAKAQSKARFTDWLKSTMNVVVDPGSIFDSQVKRIHEYKRQLLNGLRVVVLYNRLRENPDLEVAPRTFFFSGKAAPAYKLAKLIIKFLTSIADTVNADPVMRDRLKVVFLPEYCVSLAERLIPATDVSNQISTAGYEASGTGNMKFMMNGALTIGTRDGATIEMAEAAGEENFFLFGLTAEQVAGSRGWYNPHWHYEHEAETHKALDLIFADHFNPKEPGIFEPLREPLLTRDQYMHLADLTAYLEADRQLLELYADPQAWTRKAVLNIASSGQFSSDRTIAEYASEIWGAKPCPVP